MKPRSLITKFNKYCLAFVMGLMVTFGNELIRYNPANKRELTGIGGGSNGLS